MDHHATALPGYQHAEREPWRRTAFITAAIAAVELVVLVVVALAFIAKPLADHGAKTAAKANASAHEESTGKNTPLKTAPARSVTLVEAGLSRADTAVLVLNGNGIAGSARDAAKRLRGLDYPLTGVGDASRHDFPHTIVMYRPELEGEGQRLARDLHLDLRRAVPLDGMRPGALGNAKLVLIVGG